MSDRNENKPDNGMVSGIEKMAEEIQGLVAIFFESILRFMKDAAHWYEDAGKRIREYLARFFSALFKFLGALGKLSLFYIPSLILVFLGVMTGTSWFYVGAAVWTIAISAIGLTYKRGKNNH